MPMLHKSSRVMKKISQPWPNIYIFSISQFWVLPYVNPIVKRPNQYYKLLTISACQRNLAFPLASQLKINQNMSAFIFLGDSVPLIS
jgi:hypothetical protein